MTADIQTAFAEAVTDTFTVMASSPALTDPSVVKQLDTPYAYLAEVTGLAPQVLFEMISRAVHDVRAASDHVAHAAGVTPRGLICITCGSPMLVHGGHERLLAVIQDIEAVAKLHADAG